MLTFSASPQAPTPRRSLFTTHIFQPRDAAGTLGIVIGSCRANANTTQERLNTPPIEVEEATTPPIVASSSPGFDGMDMTPLPHKAPYFQVTLPSPSPIETHDDIDLIVLDQSSPFEVPTPLQALPVQPPSFLALPECVPSSNAVDSPLLTLVYRRKRPVTRPSLSRSKGFSTSHIPTPQRSPSPETQLPPFRFGNVAPRHLSCSSTPSLLDSFAESPVEEIKPWTAGGMLPPSRRTSVSNVVRASGSPVTGHVRKPSGGRPAQVRPQRKIMRRSLSMFQHPNDVMREEQHAFEPQPTLASVMDVDQDHAPKLPHFIPDTEPDSLPRITQQTMADVLDSKYSTQYDRVMIIDCRFEYEYEGGHIQDAVNFNDKQQLTQQLFDHCPPSPSTLLILHCEYSVHRAPLTAKFLRSHDRNVNSHCYPQLTFPEIYILDGGYSKFFEQHSSKCYPQNYVEMNDQRHEKACERGMAKVKARQKLFRNQTFAFGETAQDETEDSPTTQGRGLGPRSRSTFDVGPDLAQGIGMSFQRRMASY